MKIVNSISGGKTSAYISANYKADYDVFSLVRTTDIKCVYPDSKIRQFVSDKIQKEFIGTLEDDMIIRTMIDLEQFIGREITWLSGKTFDDITKNYLPNVTQRFCTTEMKLKPMFEWWRNNFKEPVKMRIGFRANEMSRAKRMESKLSEKGFSTFKAICGKSKNGKRNKWKEYEWQKPEFPLITDRIFKDKIVNYWKDKPVNFAYMNNCIGCFHRNEVLLKFMSEKHPNKLNWFINSENSNKNNLKTFKNGIDYQTIKNSFKQIRLFEEDFNECDSGYCGL